MTIFDKIELAAWLIVACVIAFFVYKSYKIPEPTKEQLLSYENMYKAALSARFTFQNHGYAGLDKPEYPLFNGKPINNSAKNILDKYYSDAKSMGLGNK